MGGEVGGGHGGAAEARGMADTEEEFFAYYGDAGEKKWKEANPEALRAPPPKMSRNEQLRAKKDRERAKLEEKQKKRKPKPYRKHANRSLQALAGQQQPPAANQ